MKNLEDLEVLALLENHRIRSQSMDTDTALRIAISIVAEAIGYEGKHSWASLLREQNLIPSSDNVQEEYKESVKLYNKLNDKLNQNLYNSTFTPIKIKLEN